MNIELRPVADIKPYESNPRINDAAVEAVARSIREFGFRQPIVVDSDGVIVVGHTRWKAAKSLGLEQVPVHVATGLDPERIRAYRIADNQLHTLSDWDYDLLPIELSDLRGLDVDLDLLGFSSEDLERILGAGVHGNEGLTDPDDVPEPPDEAITQPGDLWLLGDHRLLCGDSASAHDVDRLLSVDPARTIERPSGSDIKSKLLPVHLVNTDPPYNVKVEPRSNNAIVAGNSSFSLMKSQPLSQAVDATRGGKGLHHHQAFDVARLGSKKATHKKMRAKDRPLANDFVTDEAFDKLLTAWFGNIARVLEPGRGFYIWGGYRKRRRIVPNIGSSARDS